MSNSKKAIKKPSHSTRRIVLITLVVALLLIGGTVLYKYHQKNQAIAKERGQYAQAEKDLDATAAKIIANFGKPDSNINLKYCGYTSNPDEFEKGDLYCNVEDFILYPTSDSAAATVMTNRIEDSLNEERNIQYEDQSRTGNIIPPIRIGDVTYVDQALDCSRSYSYQIEQSLGDYPQAALKLKNAGQGLLIELSCSVPHPKAAYYPIKN